MNNTERDEKVKNVAMARAREVWGAEAEVTSLAYDPTFDWECHIGLKGPNGLKGHMFINSDTGEIENEEFDEPTGAN